MALLSFLYTWAKRLPGSFTAVLVLLLGLCLAITSLAVDRGFTVWLSNVLASLLVWTAVWIAVRSWTIVRVGTEGVVILGLIGVSALISYNAAAFIYRIARKRVPPKQYQPFIPAPQAPPAAGQRNLAAQHLQSLKESESFSQVEARRAPIRRAP